MNDSIAAPHLATNYTRDVNTDVNIERDAESSNLSITRTNKKEVFQRSFVHDGQYSKHSDATDDMADAAALMVILYLLFLSLLIVGGIVLGFVVIVQYGLVVLIAVIGAIVALGVVAAVLTSVITRDAKLSKARSKVKAWHVQVKDVILEEIQNLKEDLNAFSQGILLLTCENDRDNNAGNCEEYRNKTCNDFSGGHATENAGNISGDNAPGTTSYHATNVERPSQHKPKSVIFRYVVAPFTGNSSKKENGKKRNFMRRLWKPKQKGTDENVELERQSAINYMPPLV